MKSKVSFQICLDFESLAKLDRLSTDRGAKNYSVTIAQLIQEYESDDPYVDADANAFAAQREKEHRTTYRKLLAQNMLPEAEFFLSEHPGADEQEPF